MTVAQRILVLGGTGFIGSNFANLAAARGAQVWVAGRGEPRVPLAGAITLRQADAASLTQMRALVAEARPDTVVFCVSQLVPRSANVSADATFAEIRAMLNLLQCADEHGLKQIVYCSSGGAIYGDSNGARTEADVCLPKSVYGRLKLQTEQILQVFSESRKQPAAILRIANPYGPGQSPTGTHGVIPVFIARVAAHQPITVLGSLDAAKDYFFVGDLCEAMWAAIAARANGVFNVGSGVATRLGTIVEKISEACGTPALQDFRDLPSGDVASFFLDITKAERELGWCPKTSLDEGIALTRDWLQQNAFPGDRGH